MLRVRVTGYLGMDIPRFLALVFARRRLIAGMVAGAAALALLASLTQNRQYRAGADLLFGGTPSAGAIFPGGSPATSQRPDRAAATNLALASLDTVAARVTQRLGGHVTLEELRDSVSIEPQGDSDVVTVAARSGSPTEAAVVANAFATEIVALRRETARADVQRAIDAIDSAVAARTASGRPPDARTRALQSRLAELEVVKALQSGNVQLVQRATPPRHPSSPRPVRNAVVAAFVALVIGLLLIIALTRSEDQIRDEEELAAILNAPILARVPATRPDRRLWPGRARGDDPEFREAFEFLRLNLELRAPEDGTFVVAVTSPSAAEGKTTVTGWLARSAAAAQREVVALDMDLSRPALGRSLAERPAVDGRVHVLTARDHLGVQPGLISKGRMERLFADVREDADLVIVDTAPVSLAADATAVVAAADGVVLVIDTTVVRRRDVLAAGRQLRKAHANLVGIVLNRVAKRLPAMRGDDGLTDRGRLPDRPEVAVRERVAHATPRMMDF
jgi:Mrp family chromosome partitioning ATPase